MGNRPIHVGSVSYLNAKPLIYGLDRDAGVYLHLEVPANLLEGLTDRRYDVALLPTIDYQRLPGLRIIPAGGIACDGPTLTVRIFSRVPVAKIRTLACDTHSHSSVALARVILHNAYGADPELIPWDAAAHPREPAGTDAMLLIGDKVVLAEPTGYAHQLDLGEAWKALTGLPFVFAVWMARDDAAIGDLPRRLQRARVEGTSQIGRIVAEHALPRGWPEDVAGKYLAHYLQYDITPRHLEAIARFHQLAGELGAVNAPVRELVLAPI